MAPGSSPLPRRPTKRSGGVDTIKRTLRAAIVVCGTLTVTTMIWIDVTSVAMLDRLVENDRRVPSKKEGESPRRGENVPAAPTSVISSGRLRHVRSKDPKDSEPVVKPRKGKSQRHATMSVVKRRERNNEWAAKVRKEKAAGGVFDGKMFRAARRTIGPDERKKRQERWDAKETEMKKKKNSKESAEIAKLLADAVSGREEIVKLLKNSGAEPADRPMKTKFDRPSLVDLPTWSSVTSLYGTNPIVFGLDTCQNYRDAVPVHRRIVAPAGLYNTGTNVLSKMLKKNLRFEGGGFTLNETDPFGPHNGTMWQVPWGKHIPVSYRNRFVATAGGAGVNQTDVLPIVLIKDPYFWFVSMCAETYDLHWIAAPRCPNLVRDHVFQPEERDPTKGVEVRVIYKPEDGPEQPGNMTKHESLVHVWKYWYEGYIKATFPRLIVRFEDFLFHPEYVMEKIITCAGGTYASGSKKKLVYNPDTAKPGHLSPTDMIRSVAKYGSDRLRYNWFDAADLDYARKVLNGTDNLFERFGYSWPPESSELPKYLTDKYGGPWKYPRTLDGPGL